MGPPEPPRLKIHVEPAHVALEPDCAIRLRAASCCGETVTSSEDALRAHGYSETYVRGYHEGCESGKQAGGDFLSKRVRDVRAYGSNSDYTSGWDYGFVTCRDEEIREEAIAAAVGSAIAGASARGTDGIDAQEMLDGFDTSAIQAAGW